MMFDKKELQFILEALNQAQIKGIETAGFLARLGAKIAEEIKKLDK